MFVLWSFGNAIENGYYPAYLGAFSAEKYMVLYFGGIVVASVPSYLRHNRNPGYAALGASGGVSAVVFAAILFEPWQNLPVRCDRDSADTGWRRLPVLLLVQG